MKIYRLTSETHYEDSCTTCVFFENDDKLQGRLVINTDMFLMPVNSRALFDPFGFEFVLYSPSCMEQVEVTILPNTEEGTALTQELVATPDAISVTLHSGPFKVNLISFDKTCRASLTKGQATFVWNESDAATFKLELGAQP